MSRAGRCVAAVVSVATLGLTVAGLPQVASADTGASAVAQRVCDPGGKAPYYSFSNKKSIYLPAKGSRIYGDSGVTLGIAKGEAWTIGGSVTGTASAEAGVIFAKASASLAISVSASRTTSTTYSGSWTVPSSQKQGWFETGTINGYSFSWERYHYKSPCTKVVEAHGTGKAPTKTAALTFKHS